MLELSGFRPYYYSMKKSIHVDSVCIITNVGYGCGKDTAINLANKGVTVIITGPDEKLGNELRNEIIAMTQNQTIEFMLLDLSMQTSIRKFVSDFRQSYQRLDYLILNDQIYGKINKKKTYTEENIETNWAIYHIGPVILAGLLLPLLKNSPDARILTIIPEALQTFTSIKVNNEDPEFRNCHYSCSKAYYQAKLAQLMFIQHFSSYIKETNITINGLSLPYIKTTANRYGNMSRWERMELAIRNMVACNPRKPARVLLYFCLSPRVKRYNGKLFSLEKRMLKPSKYARKPETIDSVMTITRRYILK